MGSIPSRVTSLKEEVIIMDAVQQYLQDEIDTTFDHIEVVAKHTIEAINDIVNTIGNLSEEEQRNYVLMMDQHIKQIELVLSLIKQANTIMRMKNRYNDPND